MVDAARQHAPKLIVSPNEGRFIMANAELAEVGLHGSADRYGNLCVHGVLDLRRAFTRDDVERAMYATVADFPVLGCMYEQGFFRDQWLPVSAPISEMVHVGNAENIEADTQAWLERWIEPARERPFRAVLFPKSDGCRLVLSLSHLAADGAGMAAVAHVFGAHLYGVSPALPVEERRDVRRALDGLGIQHIPVFLRDLARSVIQPWRVWSAGPRNRPYAPDDSGRWFARQIVIEKSTVDALMARCGRHVRVNDLLVAAVCMVTAKRSSYGPLASLYTMDLRRFSRTPHLSAANVSSILTTVVPRETTSNIADAVRAVEAETKKHRESLAGPAFLLLPMLIAGRSPHAMVRLMLPIIQPLLVDLPVSRGLIFTNVGKIDQGLGPLANDLVNIRVVGPQIQNIPAPAIIAWGLRGRIHLELFAPPGLGEAALDELESELREVLSVEAHVRP